jgi:glutathione S-transferase
MTFVLWHLPVSNYNEKARWALDYKGVPHLRRAAVAGPHSKIAKRLTGGSTFPILIVGDEAIGDSTAIIETLERLRPEPPLYPRDRKLRRLALDHEEFFDEELGPHVRLLVLHSALPHPDLVFSMFAPQARGLRKLIARASYGRIRRGVIETFGIDEQSVARAYAKIADAGRLLAEATREGPYLVGDEFTVADLTLASLVAPAVAPEQFPYPQPQRHHPAFAELQLALERAGLSEWAREMYARHRGRSAEISAAPRTSAARVPSPARLTARERDDAREAVASRG